MHGRDVYQLQEIEAPETTTKIEKRIRRAKEVMWMRWKTEYVRALRERHDVTKVKPYHPKIGEVVLVVDDSKNRHKWHHGLVCELLQGKKDGVVRGVKMIVKNKVWERPLQLICPLEIQSTMSMDKLNKRIMTASKQEKEKAVELEPMLKRKEMTRGAAKKANEKIREIAEEDDE
eukprot:gene13095-14438_t